MSAYLVASVDIHDPETYRKYEQGATEILKDFKRKSHVSDLGWELYEGDVGANHFVIVEFESMDEIKRFYNLDSYKEVMKLRLASATTNFMVAMPSRA